MYRFPPRPQASSSASAPLGQATKFNLFILPNQDLPGDKLILPSSAFKILTDKNVPFPYTFKVSLMSPASSSSTKSNAPISTANKPKFVYASVQEFSAEEGCVLAPNWLLRHLGCAAGDAVVVATHRVPKGDFAQFQPISMDEHLPLPRGLDLTQAKAALELHLSQYVCLTKGMRVSLPVDSFSISGSSSSSPSSSTSSCIDLLVTEVRPSDYGGIMILNTDLAVDFLPPPSPSSDAPASSSASSSSAMASSSASAFGDDFGSSSSSACGLNAASSSSFGDQFDSSSASQFSFPSPSCSSSASSSSPSLASSAILGKQVNGQPVTGANTMHPIALGDTVHGVVPVGEYIYFTLEIAPSSSSSTAGIIVQLDSTPPLTSSSASSSVAPTSMKLARTVSYENRAAGSDADLYINQVTGNRVSLPSQSNYQWSSTQRLLDRIRLDADIGAGGMFVIAVHGYGPGDSYFTLKVDSESNLPSHSSSSSSSSLSIAGVEPCPNCGKSIASLAMQRHLPNCRRLFYRCPHEPCVSVGLVLAVEEKQKHEKMRHSEFACECGESIQGQLALAAHRLRHCARRRVVCPHCATYFSHDRLQTHQLQCGARSDTCYICREVYLIRDRQEHFGLMHGCEYEPPSLSEMDASSSSSSSGSLSGFQGGVSNKLLESLAQNSLNATQISSTSSATKRPSTSASSSASIIGGADKVDIPLTRTFRTADDILKQRQQQVEAELAKHRVQPAISSSVSSPPSTTAAGSSNRLEMAPKPPRACSIRVRLPDGRTCQRQFVATSTLYDVLAWLSAELLAPSSPALQSIEQRIQSILSDQDGLRAFASCAELVSTAPHRVFKADEFAMTLAAAGLVPQGALRLVM